MRKAFDKAASCGPLGVRRRTSMVKMSAAEP